MSTAIEMSPEMLSFIQGPIATAAQPSGVNPTAAEPPQVSQPPANASVPADEIDDFVQKPRRQARTHRQPAPADASAATRKLFHGLTQVLIPLTTRLSPSTASALRRAGLEQRLHGREPATVQEIAEEALKAWLRENGYLA